MKIGYFCKILSISNFFITKKINFLIKFLNFLIYHVSSLEIDYTIAFNFNPSNWHPCMVMIFTFVIFFNDPVKPHPSITTIQGCCIITSQFRLKLFFLLFGHPQYVHDVVLTSIRRRFNVMDVVWMSKQFRECAYWVVLKNIFVWYFWYKLIVGQKMFIAYNSMQLFKYVPYKRGSRGVARVAISPRWSVK